MNIFITGLNYKITPLDIREKLNFNMLQQKEALNYICKVPKVTECVLISTCNRTEVYVYSQEEGFDSELLENALCRLKNLSIYEFKKYFYNYSGKKAVKHLFKVASGLDSMVLGEDQILGQVKAAYELAIELGASSVILNTLFREAVTAAKEVKTNTELTKNSLSIASLAVKVMEDVFRDTLIEKKIMVIGTGKIGSIVLKNLKTKGITNVLATSRNHNMIGCEKKENLEVEYINYNDRYKVIDECDIVISSTTSPHYTITRDMLEKFIYGNRKRLYIDLAVPRDIDADIGSLKGILYMNMDDLKTEAGKNIDKRTAEAVKAEEVINKYLIEFEQWYEFRKVLPVIKEVQNYVDGMLGERISQTIAKLKSTNDEDKEIVKTSMTNTVNEILNKFVYRMRECSNAEDMKTYFRCLGNIVKSED